MGFGKSLKKAVKKVGKAVKKVASNPIVKVAGTAAAGFFGGPAGAALAGGVFGAADGGGLQGGLMGALGGYAGGVGMNAAGIGSTFGNVFSPGGALSGMMGSAATGTGGWADAGGAILNSTTGAPATLASGGGLLSTLGQYGGEALKVLNSLGGASTPQGSSFLNSIGGLGGLLGMGANAAGGYLQGKAATDAAKTYADAQTKAAQIAADAAKFRPVGVTNRFGSSQFGYDANGNLTSAGYNLSPEAKAQQDQLMDQSQGYLNQAGAAKAATAPMAAGAQSMFSQGQTGLNRGESLLNQAEQWRPDVNQLKQQYAPMADAGQRSMALGNQYLGTSPQDQAQKYMRDQQALLAAGRNTDMAAMRANLQAQGRGGLAVGGGDGMLAANPEMNAYYNSLRQQDLGLAAQATQGGMDYAKFGNQLVGAGGDLYRQMYQNQAAAYDPYKQAMGVGMDYSKYGAGMMGTGGDMLNSMYNVQTNAYNPYNAALGGAQNLEQLGQNTMDLGINIGAKGTAAAAQAGMLQGQGMANAAQTMQPANQYSPWGNLLSGFGNTMTNQYGQPQNRSFA